MRQRTRSVCVCVFLRQYFIFWLHHTACRILVPQPGIEPMALAVEARSLSHWTTRKVQDNILDSIYQQILSPMTQTCVS